MIQIHTYLKHLGVQIPAESPLETLRLLQYHQVRTNPFENLDILNGRPLSMDPASLFEKLVIQKRGGVCYELNHFFHQVLCQLGYDVQLYAATTYRNGTKSAAENTHMFNMVELDGRTYLVDVGFGGNSPSAPIPEDGEEILDTDGKYRIKAEKDRYILQKKRDTEWEPLYEFEDIPRERIYFEPIMRMVEHSPQSPFNKARFLTIVTDTGRVTLSENSLIIVDHNEKTKLDISEEQIPSVIAKYFDIRL